MKPNWLLYIRNRSRRVRAQQRELMLVLDIFGYDPQFFKNCTTLNWNSVDILSLVPAVSNLHESLYWRFLIKFLWIFTACFCFLTSRTERWNGVKDGSVENKQEELHHASVESVVCSTRKIVLFESPATIYFLTFSENASKFKRSVLVKETVRKMQTWK